MSLRLDWCSHEAAMYAVKRWHYSRSLQAGKSVKIGVWEDECFIGAVVFTSGSNGNLGRPYGLGVIETSELSRVALALHKMPVTRIVSTAIRLLRKQSPGLRLIVSYADPEQGHIGAIYQAGNWLYAGLTSQDRCYMDPRGKRWHSRVVSQSGFRTQFGHRKAVPRPDQLRKVQTAGKYRYLMPLDDEIRRRIEPLRKPYPKRVRSENGDTSVLHTEEGGSTPTRTLQTMNTFPL